MPVPKTYRKSTERVIQSFDFIDIASGIGYVSFYGYSERDASGTKYRLASTRLFSYDTFTTVTGAGTIDLDFDVTFNKPQNLKGELRVSFPITAAGGGTPIATATVYVRKWDGTTETPIASTVGATQNATTFAEKRMTNMSVNIADRAHFKSGETLRITLEITFTSGPASDFYVGHSPKDQDGGVFVVGTNIGTTVFEVQVPFQLRL